MKVLYAVTFRYDRVCVYYIIAQQYSYLGKIQLGLKYSERNKDKVMFEINNSFVKIPTSVVCAFLLSNLRLPF